MVVVVVHGGGGGGGGVRLVEAGPLTDLAVQPTGSQQRRVQRVRPVGGHDHLDPVEGVEAIHLVQQLGGGGGGGRRGGGGRTVMSVHHIAPAAL